MTLTMQQLSLQGLSETASNYNVPLLDTLFIALNWAGLQSDTGMPRARMQVRPTGQSDTWQIILPLDSSASPFEHRGTAIMLDDEPVADIVGIENDDVVLTYLRAGGHSVTLNTHSRSTCIGCLFCPNVIEDAADATLRTSAELADLLRWVTSDNSWGDLRGVGVITVCTGCFQTPLAAIQHMAAVQQAARPLGFNGRLHLLSSVVRDADDLKRIAAELNPFHLTLTVECFTRRGLLLKDTKASLSFEQTCTILDTCAELGIMADFTYVVGLDPLQETIDGLRQLAGHVTTFPRLQVFQAHNSYMRRAMTPEAEQLSYFLEVRNAIEPAYSGHGLQPTSWENYRPLWYSRFDGELVAGPRI